MGEKWTCFRCGQRNTGPACFVCGDKKLAQEFELVLDAWKRMLWRPMLTERVKDGHKTSK